MFAVVDRVAWRRILDTTVSGTPLVTGSRRTWGTGKWRLALDVIDQLNGWGQTPPVLAADEGYGQNAEFRAGLADWDLAHVVSVRGDLTAHPETFEPSAPPWKGNGCRPQPRYRETPQRITALAHAGDVGRSPR
ncbi:hypothetical protein DN069_20835 [Streptacidiphilus pinicola]|uniref:Transposase IS701-like DDE domain-containing protein n=1 Tax=Streptacidiphilus pinicola TaxID=2219663 RepID=A0A2X0IF74_9ACTN|nr:hypothetical protein DN069_20835 [Streptacidiphilus pinicola]